MQKTTRCVLLFAMVTACSVLAKGFPVVDQVVRSDGQILHNAQIKVVENSSVTIVAASGTLEMTLESFLADLPFARSLDPSAEILRPTIFQNSPHWEPDKAWAIFELMGVHDLVIVPDSQVPGVYFKNKWLPLGMLMSDLKRAVPELERAGGAADRQILRLPNTQLGFVSPDGTRFRMLFAGRNLLNLSIQPASISILGGIGLYDDIDHVVAILGPASAAFEDGPPFAGRNLTYRRSQYVLDLDFDKRPELRAVTFRTPGFFQNN
jgi:hypothetical protein